MDETFTNREMVVYALYCLGGATKSLHTEDIALKCFELWPSAFSWTKHTQFPDKDIVRVALTDARKEKFGNLVDGRSGQTRGQSNVTKRRKVADGWFLTGSGISWCEANKGRFESAHPIPKEHRQKSMQFLRRVRKHKVFALYSDNPEKFYPSIGDLADLLRCRVDAAEAVWTERFERIRKHAAATGQDEYFPFVGKSIEAYEKQR